MHIMPLDKHIADFLAASSGAPQPASLAELRVATDVELLRLQGEEETGGAIQHHVVIADDGYEIELRVYTLPPRRQKSRSLQCCLLMAADGAWGRCHCTIDPVRHWRMLLAGKYSPWITVWRRSSPSRGR
jgi:hypothetical protein